MNKKLYGPYDVAHPAVFSSPLLPVFKKMLDKYLHTTPIHVLDPFAGIGRIHELASDGIFTYGLEIAPKWAACHPNTKCGDVLQLRKYYRRKFDAIVTSPCYGNRFADHHNARDGSHRRSYFHDYGPDLPFENNAGVMHWGDEYREFHELAWLRVNSVLRNGGLFILNIKNHIRDGEVQRVAEWHVKQLQALGLKKLTKVTVHTTLMKAGENRDLRFPERIYVFEKSN